MLFKISSKFQSIFGTIISQGIILLGNLALVKIAFFKLNTNDLASFILLKRILPIFQIIFTGGFNSLLIRSTTEWFKFQLIPFAILFSLCIYVPIIILINIIKFYYSIKVDLWYWGITIALVSSWLSFISTYYRSNHLFLYSNFINIIFISLIPNVSLLITRNLKEFLQVWILFIFITYFFFLRRIIKINFLIWFLNFKKLIKSKNLKSVLFYGYSRTFIYLLLNMINFIPVGVATLTRNQENIIVIGTALFISNILFYIVTSPILLVYSSYLKHTLKVKRKDLFFKTIFMSIILLGITYILYLKYSYFILKLIASSKYKIIFENLQIFHVFPLINFPLAIIYTAINSMDILRTKIIYINTLGILLIIEVAIFFLLYLLNLLNPLYIAIVHNSLLWIFQILFLKKAYAIL